MFAVQPPQFIRDAWTETVETLQRALNAFWPGGAGEMQDVNEANVTVHLASALMARNCHCFVEVHHPGKGPKGRLDLLSIPGDRKPEWFLAVEFKNLYRKKGMDSLDHDVKALQHFRLAEGLEDLCDRDVLTHLRENATGWGLVGGLAWESATCNLRVRQAWQAAFQKTPVPYYSEHIQQIERADGVFLEPVKVRECAAAQSKHYLLGAIFPLTNR